MQEFRTEDVLAALEAARGTTCGRCSRAVCGHEFLLDFALGYAEAPLCLACLARDLGKSRDELLDQMLAHVGARECLLAGWERATRDEGPCLGWPSSTRPLAPATEELPPGPIDASWDAGDLGCGELVLELRGRLLALPPGAVIEVRATDPGAPEDLPAWCRLTGHALVGARPPLYRIRRKEDR